MQEDVVNSSTMHSRIAGFVRSNYELADRYRKVHESRWLTFFDQFRGRYSAEEANQLSRIKEKNPFASEAFIKITKTKTLAAVGSLYEVLTAGNRIPITVESTPEPEGISKKVYVDKTNDPKAITPEDLANTYGFPGDGRSIERGTTFQDMFNGLGKKYSKLFKGDKLIAGKSPDPATAIEVHPAKEAALNMDSKIQDQLLESDTIKKLESCILEMVMFGTGVIKGPFTYSESVPSWTYDPDNDREPKYTIKKKLRPFISSPNIWNIYPDPYAESSSDVDYVIERHKLTKANLLKLRNQPGFDREAINAVAMRPGSGSYNDWEYRLKDVQSLSEDPRYEVLEYWGNVTVEEAKSFGIEDIPDNLSEQDTVSVCIFVADNYCIKKQLNPFLPERIPYFFIPYEEHPYQLWGIGVPENMEDSQRMINMHTRAAQDNLRLAGSCMLEVSEKLLVPNQGNDIYAGKIWRKQGATPGQSIFPITFTNTAPAHLQFINEAGRWADQSSGIPSIMHGQTGITGSGRTAYGINAIMQSGNLSIRTVLKNIDKELLQPLGEAMFNWNMQFNTDLPEIRGDMKIVAKGVGSFNSKDIQNQKLISLLQMVMNPAMAPFMNFPNLLKEIVISMDLDPNDLINDVTVAQLYAKIIGEQANVNFGNGQGANEGGGQAGPQANGEVLPTGPDKSSGGNPGGSIGTGVTPTSGETTAA